MIGHYCKVVIKEPGDTKAHVVIGTIQEIEHQTRLVMVKSYNGCYCLSIDAIVAIKGEDCYEIVGLNGKKKL
jgi:hypothetical protein